MATVEELEARIAALELVAAIALTGAGHKFFASAWPTRADAFADKAVNEMRESLIGDDADAAETSIRKMFDRSKQPWPELS
jgi:hypothetical protein